MSDSVSIVNLDTSGTRAEMFATVFDMITAELSVQIIYGYFQPSIYPPHDVAARVPIGLLESHILRARGCLLQDFFRNR